MAVFSGNVRATVRLDIVNNTGGSIVTPFQQYIGNVPLWDYQAYASDIRQINFQDGNGNILPSWLETAGTVIGSVSSTAVANVSRASYWVNLPSSYGTILPGSTVTIYLVINTGLVLDGTVTGEQPTATSVYGQYDNGASVFNYYWNFAGTSLPSGWKEQANGNNITVNNGITMTTIGPNYYVSYVWYDTPINPQNTVLEAYFITATSNGAAHDETIDYVSSNLFPTTTGWPSNPFIAVGMHNTFEIFNGINQVSGNTQFTPVLVSLEYISNNTAIPLFNYNSQRVPSESASSLMNSAYPTIELNWGGYNTLSIQYMRIRACPPNGVMPVVNRYYCCLRNLL
jgi:hypothetical protein